MEFLTSLNKMLCRLGWRWDTGRRDLGSPQMPSSFMSQKLEGPCGPKAGCLALGRPHDFTPRTSVDLPDVRPRCLSSPELGLCESGNKRLCPTVFCHLRDIENQKQLPGRRQRGLPCPLWSPWSGCGNTGGHRRGGAHPEWKEREGECVSAARKARTGQGLCWWPAC